MKKAKKTRTPEFANTIAENFYWLKKFAMEDGCWEQEPERLPLKLADTTSNVKKVANGFIITDDKGKQYVEFEGTKLAENMKQILVRKLQNMTTGEKIDVRIAIYGEQNPCINIVGAVEAIHKGMTDMINRLPKGTPVKDCDRPGPIPREPHICH